MTLQAPRRGSRAYLLALSFVGIVACKAGSTSVDAAADSFSKDVCEAVIKCACEYPNGALYEHCVGQLTVGFESTAQLNLVEGLSFDGDCADQTLASIKEVGCGVTIADPEAECEPACKLWYGPVGKGGTCTTVNGFDNCKQGLACGDDSVCVNPCAEPKLPELGEVCAQILGCVEGAYCDTTVDLVPVCKALPLAGFLCTEPGELCAEGLLCDRTDPDNRICTPPPGEGQECIDFQCAAGLFCNVLDTPATCAAPPSLGQACPVGACQAPYVCNIEGFCEDPPPQICYFYQGLPLADCAGSEFTCDNGACIDEALACDGTPQCGDGSDEAPFNPSCVGGGCGGGEFECGEGTCIDSASECDTLPDCPDGSDEAPFNPSCVGGGCGGDEFECGEGSCISADFACDSLPDCPDGSDEAPFNADCV